MSLKKKKIPVGVLEQWETDCTGCEQVGQTSHMTKGKDSFVHAAQILDDWPPHILEDRSRIYSLFSDLS